MKIWQMGVSVRNHEIGGYDDKVTTLFDSYTKAVAEMLNKYPGIDADGPSEHSVLGCIEFYCSEDDEVMVTLQSRWVW